MQNGLKHRNHYIIARPNINFASCIHQTNLGCKSNPFHIFFQIKYKKVIVIAYSLVESYIFAENLKRMSKISWSEFIIVWLTVCVVIDIVFMYLYKKNGTVGVSVAEERKAKTKQLNTPYRDDVSYEAQVRPVSMTKVAALDPFVEKRVGESTIECVDEDEDELTELQQETADIVKMLFG